MRPVCGEANGREQNAEEAMVNDKIPHYCAHCGALYMMVECNTGNHGNCLKCGALNIGFMTQKPQPAEGRKVYALMMNGQLRRIYASMEALRRDLPTYMVQPWSVGDLFPMMVRDRWGQFCGSVEERVLFE